MIQGYAIYLRTHRKTGKQYGGMCWWTKPTQTPEKACTRRWRAEDTTGIRGLFGGFDSKIVLAEQRSKAPACSDGFYRIRIAVDEDRTIQAIPARRRLNLLSPFVHLSLGFFHEEVARIGGYTQGVINAQKGLGVCGRSPQQRIKDARKGNLALSGAVRAAGGRTAGRLTKAKGIGIFGMTRDQRIEVARKGGSLGGALGQQRGGPKSRHVRWHSNRGIINPKCEFCRKKPS
jgi:hypothetical protein